MKRLPFKIPRFFAIIFVVAVALTLLSQLGVKVLQSWEAGRVKTVCVEYYEGLSQQGFIARASYDSDGDGYGSCDVYVNGARAESLECDAAYFLNTGKCKAKVLSTK